MFKLLSTANPKIQKGTKYGYLSFILHLAPADLSGREVCPKRTAGCTQACLNTAGRGGMFRKGENTNVIQQARIRKTCELRSPQGIEASVPPQWYQRSELGEVSSSNAWQEHL